MRQEKPGADRRATSHNLYIAGQAPPTSSNVVTRVHPTGAPDYGGGHSGKGPQPVDWRQARLPRRASQVLSHQGNKELQWCEASPRWQAEGGKDWIAQHATTPTEQAKPRGERKGGREREREGGRRLSLAHPARAGSLQGHHVEVDSSILPPVCVCVCVCLFVCLKSIKVPIVQQSSVQWL